MQLIEQSPTSSPSAPTPEPGVEWLVADACEVTSLRQAGLERCDVVVAATGDDEDNLVISLLAKQEFGVPRVVARVNHPKNEWLFNENWGVDLSVSTPHLITALVEEAVSVGRLVRILQFEGGNVRLVEVTLAENAPVVDQAINDLDIPRDATIVAVVRGEHVVMPRGDTIFEAGDEVLAMVTARLRRRRPPDPDRRLRARRVTHEACRRVVDHAFARRRRVTTPSSMTRRPGDSPAILRRPRNTRGQHAAPVGDRRFERVGAGARNDAHRAHLARDAHRVARARPGRIGVTPSRVDTTMTSCSRSASSTGFVSFSTNLRKATRFRKPFRSDPQGSAVRMANWRRRAAPAPSLRTSSRRARRARPRRRARRVLAAAAASTTRANDSGGRRRAAVNAGRR